MPPKASSSSGPRRRSQRQQLGTTSIPPKSPSQPVKDESTDSDGEVADTEDDGDTEEGSEDSDQDDQSDEAPDESTTTYSTQSYVDDGPDNSEDSEVVEKEAQEKRRLQAIENCQLVLNSLKNGSTNFTAFAALKVVNEFAEQSVLSLSFSQVKKVHLDRLRLAQGTIRLNDDVLKSRAKARVVSDRFTKTQSHMKAMGSSNKERLSEFVCFDYMLESMSEPGKVHERVATQLKPKCSPQLQFESHLHKLEEAGAGLALNGVVDMTTFLLHKDSKLQEHDLHTLGKLKLEPEVQHKSVVTVEIKRQSEAFGEVHISEGVAQAKNASAVLGNEGSQKFILTDGARWKFCILEDSKYYLSNTLQLGDYTEAQILTALDSWIWEDTRVSFHNKLWEYAKDVNESQPVNE